VQLVWDWRLARVYDEEERVLDEIIWGGVRTKTALVERLTLLMNGRMTIEARTLSERFPEIQVTPPTSIDSWPALGDEEIALLQDASLKLAERGVADSAADSDRRLEHLVMALDEARSSQNSLESHIVEWAGLFLPTLDLDLHRSSIASAVSNSSNLLELAAVLDVVAAEVELGPHEWSGLHSLASSTVNMTDTVDSMEKSVRELTNTYLPSVSNLIGPLLAAKLCTAAHGRARMARLPASTIQVLGAEKAFFLHIRQGTDPPKHGHIFQHPWICRSPKWTRGSIARMLAAKVAIAVRVDHFGGEPWTSKQVAEVEKKVGEIRARRSRR
jgi:nucleolar protein 56